MDMPEQREDRRTLLRSKAERLARAKPLDECDISSLGPDEIRKLIHELNVHRIELEMQNDELRASYAALETSRDRYSRLFNQAPVAYFRLDAKGRISQANRGGSELLAADEQKLTEGRIQDFVCSRDQDRIFSCLRHAIRSRGRAQCDVEMAKYDGSCFIAHVEALAQKDERGKTTECLMVVIDITERKVAENALRSMNETLEQRIAERTVELAAARDVAEEASVAKSQFLANMSHELRTPLNSMLILAQLLADNASQNLTPKQVDFAKIIHRSGSDLLELINDLLDLARIEAGRVTINEGEVRFDALCDSLGRSLAPLAQEKGLSFEFELAANLPPAMHTDSKLLQQVLRNLLGNAIKFTEAGEVRLRIAPVTSGWDPRQSLLGGASMVIALSVRDTGIGIEAGKLQIIFEAFQQADGATTRRYGGTGLGLSISRQIAGLLGGEITLASQPGVGSTFTLYLPCSRKVAAKWSPVPAVQAIAPSRQPAAVKATVPDDTGIAAGDLIVLAGRKILLVDDDVCNLFAIAAMLEAHDLEVITASGGVQALTLLAGHPDTAAVLMDMMMPEMDGYETTRRLRTLPGGIRLPVIALTASAMMGDRERCLEAGCSDYLSKPVRSAELIAKLASWIAPEPTSEQ